MDQYRSKRLAPNKNKNPPKIPSRNVQYKSKRIVENPEVSQLHDVSAPDSLLIRPVSEIDHCAYIATQPSSSNSNVNRKRKGVCALYVFGFSILRLIRN
jgi:hypothetical protein